MAGAAGRVAVEAHPAKVILGLEHDCRPAPNPPDVILVPIDYAME